MMLRFERAVWIILASGLVSGCDGTSEQRRLMLLVPDAARTVPVEGKVLVDGEPVPDIRVRLHPVENRSDPVLPKGQTGADGTFRITTYIADDGAPPGRYKVTVEWLTYQPASHRWTGPSRLAGKYSDPKTSPFEVTVGSEPVSLPTFAVESAPAAVAGKAADQRPKGGGKKRGRSTGRPAS